MPRVLSILFVALSILITSLGNNYAQEIPVGLRGGIPYEQSAVSLAQELQKTGWIYIMPSPKSPQAAWGNHDGRTTWYIGYWVNNPTKQTSSTQPLKNADGIYSGDNKGFSYWRRGGTPPPPTKIEWLCSREGGIPPK